MYKYLKDGPGRDPKDVLMRNVDANFITYKKGEGYRAYNAWSDFYEELDGMDRGREFHEVILDRPQRIKFDIDCEAAITEQEYGVIFRTIVEAILGALFVVYEINPRLCICVTEGSKKYSNHIIVKDYCVSGAAQAREFTRLVMGYIPIDCAKWIDTSVNKPTQNFRLAKCHKKDEPGRIKRILGSATICDSIITNTADCVMLKDIIAQEIYTEQVTTAMFTDEIQAMAGKAGLLVAHRFYKTYGHNYIFTRLYGSVCNLCKYAHAKDNTLIIKTVPNGCDLIVHEDCRKQIEARQGNTLMKDGASPIAPLVLGRLVDVLVAAKKTSDGQIYKALRDIKKGPLYVEAAPDIPTMSYCEPVLRDFDLIKTLFVRAAMKMGKTKKLAEYMGTHFGPDAVIRFVSFRQTFSGNIKENFPEFTLYSDEKGGLSQARLIIQVESLHRLDICAGTEPPDLLILDECESIFEQFESKNIKYFHACFDKFKYLLRHSRHVICMDAHLGQRTFNSVLSLRKGGEQYHNNTYKNATEDKYMLTGDKIKWLGMLHKSLAAGERCVIPISSLADAKIIAANISELFPMKKIKLYSRETQMSEKAEHFAHVAKYWAQYDVLMYTPTVTAGISFEVKHFNKVFGYFTNLSCPVETCMQMIGRIRDLSDKTLVIYFSCVPSCMPITREEIEQRLYATRRGLLAMEDCNEAVTCDYGKHGDIILHHTAYFPIWMENAIIRNISSNDFVRRFVHCVNMAGATCEHLSDDLFATQTGYEVNGVEYEKIASNIKSTGAVVKDAEAECIASAEDLSLESLDNITGLLMSGEDVSRDQYYALEKYKLRKSFKFTGPITKMFVATYNKNHVRHHYKNLSAMKDPDISLGELKQAELNKHLFAMNHEDTQHFDLRTEYTYNKHFACVAILRGLGFNGPLDENISHVSNLEHAVDSPEWITILRGAQHEHYIAAWTPCDLQGHIKAANQILDAMYGIKIIAVKKHNGYALSRPPLFTLDPTNTVKPVL